MRKIIIVLILVINIQQSYSQEIPNPVDLEYIYQEVIADVSGTKQMCYIEKNNPPNSEGDYGWSQAVPFYSSHEVTKTYEYQLDFSDGDFELVKNWLIETFGYDIYGMSMDNPNWYNDEMSLTDAYRYCRDNNSNITLVYYGERHKDRIIAIVIESGSIRTNTQGGLAIVYSFLREPIKGQKIIKTNKPKTHTNFNLAPNYNNAFDERYLGEHLFSCYKVGHFDSFGNATITKNGGKYQIKGNQRNKDGDWAKIDGTIKIISLDEFRFTGTIQGYNPSNVKGHNSWSDDKISNECSWIGTAKFKKLYNGGVYWRMQKIYKPCYPHLGDIDLFFK